MRLLRNIQKLNLFLAGDVWLAVCVQFHSLVMPAVISSAAVKLLYIEDKRCLNTG